MSWGVNGAPAPGSSGVQLCRHRAVRVFLRERAAPEIVVEQRDSGREEAQQVLYIDFGGDEVAAAQASPGQPTQGLVELSQVNGGKHGRA